MPTEETTKKPFPWFYLLVIILLVIAGMIFFNVSRQSKDSILLASGHPEQAPIMWQVDNEIVGAGPDLLKKICEDLKLKCEIKYSGQWQEVQDKTKTGEVDMIVAAYKTAEREEYMEYSQPYTTDPIALYVKSGETSQYSNWDSLSAKKGIITIGESYGQEFDSFIKEKLKVEEVATVKEGFNKLANGEADYFVYAYYPGKKELANLGLTDKIEYIKDFVASENFYLTISKQSPFVKYLPKMNELIEKYKADGTIDKLIEENDKK